MPRTGTRVEIEVLTLRNVELEREQALHVAAEYVGLVAKAFVATTLPRDEDAPPVPEETLEAAAEVAYDVNRIVDALSQNPDAKAFRLARPIRDDAKAAEMRLAWLGLAGEDECQEPLYRAPGAAEIVSALRALAGIQREEKKGASPALRDARGGAR